jgi:deoxycytidylate deaminase
MIYQSGIKEVYYAEEYRISEGLDFLNKCGITLKRVPEDE